MGGSVKISRKPSFGRRSHVPKYPRSLDPARYQYPRGAHRLRRLRQDAYDFDRDQLPDADEINEEEGLGE